jgi:FKBP-type peptidyl-prolyl cis-trans isomerase
MKTTISTILVLLISISISAQKQDTKTKDIKQETIKLSSSSDTLQYAVGAFIGQWMLKNNFQVSSANVFLAGMDDALKNKTLAVADSTIAPIVSAYQLSAQNERSRLLEEQLFASLKGKAGVGVLPSGVHYIEIEKGAGNRPNTSDTIVFHAKGVFPDGTLFEDTYQKEQPITNVTSNLIPGLNEAIQLMPVGSTWRIFIPSALAYGSVGLPNMVPPYTALVFDIKLIEIK